jgi:5-formyltetrahydrofolate cyclo-ligase
MNKHEIRKLALELRTRVTGREEKSSSIWEQLLARFPWPNRGWVCSYVDIDPEVVTRRYLQGHLFRRISGSTENQTIPKVELQPAQLVVPYCLPHQLNLFHLQDWSELSASHWGLQEPAHHLRIAERLVAPNQIDLFLVPGVAFDRRGNRLGYGKGYYDKLLSQRNPNSLAIALAFQVQVASAVPFDPKHDIPMDYIVTENEVIDCRTERGAQVSQTRRTGT